MLDAYKSQQEQKWHDKMYETPSDILASQHTHKLTKICFSTHTNAWFSKALQKRAFHTNNLLLKRTFRVREACEYVLVAWRLYEKL